LKQSKKRVLDGPDHAKIMPHELKVRTMGGNHLTLEVTPSSTIKELKSALLTKKDCEDPKYLKVPIEVQLLKDNSLIVIRR